MGEDRAPDSRAHLVCCLLLTMMMLMIVMMMKRERERERDADTEHEAQMKQGQQPNSLCNDKVFGCESLRAKSVTVTSWVAAVALSSKEL